MYFRDVINKLLGYAWHYACAHIGELTYRIESDLRTPCLVYSRRTRRPEIVVQPIESSFFFFPLSIRNQIFFSPIPLRLDSASIRCDTERSINAEIARFPLSNTVIYIYIYRTTLALPNDIGHRVSRSIGALCFFRARANDVRFERSINRALFKHHPCVSFFARRVKQAGFDLFAVERGRLPRNRSKLPFSFPNSRARNARVKSSLSLSWVYFHRLLHLFLPSVFYTNDISERSSYRSRQRLITRWSCCKVEGFKIDRLPI